MARLGRFTIGGEQQKGSQGERRKGGHLGSRIIPVKGPSIPGRCPRAGATAGSSSSAYVIGTGNRLLSDGTYTYAYDEDGNRTARFVDNDASGTLTPGDTEVSQYAWDSRHRLACVTDFATEGGTPTQIVHYYYDLENRWIGQTIDADGDGTIDHQTCFVYDGNQIVLQFDSSSSLPPGEGQGGGGAITAADLSHRYLWGAAVDQILADEQLSPLPPGEGQGEGGYDLTTPGPVVWPLADHLGTVRDLATYDAPTATTTVANHRTCYCYIPGTRTDSDILGEIL